MKYKDVNDFLQNATKEEKIELFTKAAMAANAEQRKVMGLPIKDTKK